MNDDPGPEPDSFVLILIFILLTVLCYTVSFATAAVTSVNEKKVRDEAENGNRQAIRLARLLDGKTRLADTHNTIICLLAVLSSYVLLVTCFSPLVRWLAELFGTEPGMWLKVLGFVITALIATVIFGAFGILLPRKIGYHRAEKSAYFFAGTMLFIRAVAAPITFLASFVSNIFVKIIGGDPKIDDFAVTEDEILSMVDASEEKGVIEESQKEMINNIFEFDDLVASDVMTHRTSIEAVEVDDDLNDVVKKAIDEGYSRIPVYEEDVDNIIGILYVKDLLKYIGTQIPENFRLADVMRVAMFIPESKNCRELFSEMTEKHLQMVVVSDEYGGVAGIVTIEDLLESIVGSMQDEFDDEQENFEKINEDTFSIEGTSDIKEAEELLDIELPEGEYDTVAGYIMSVIGRIPDPDEHPSVEYGGYKFTVEEMEDRRIERVMVEKLPPESETDKTNGENEDK